MSSYISKKEKQQRAAAPANISAVDSHFFPMTAYLIITAFIYIKRESVSVDQLDPGIKRLSVFIVCRAANKQKIVSLSYFQLCRFLRSCPAKLNHFFRTGYA